MEFKGPNKKLRHCIFYGKMLRISQSVGNVSGSRMEGETDDDRRISGSNDSFLPGLPDYVALMCLARSSMSSYGSLLRLNSKFCSLVKSGYLYGLRKQMGVEEYWVFMVIDPREWEAFDPYANKWMTLPKTPCDYCFDYGDKESLAVGTELLVFGREMFEFAIWKYSIISRSWSKGENMSRPRCLFGKATFGSIAIVAGGTDKTGNILQSAELYDSSTGKWEILPCMHTPRRLCAGVFTDGKFYVIGGMITGTDWLTCGEEFDLQTRKRKIEGMYPYANSGTLAPPLVAVVDNELYMVEYLTNMIKKYNQEKNLWDHMGWIPISADSSNGWGLAFKSCGGALLVVGGDRGRDGDAILLTYCYPKSGGVNGNLEWYVLGVKERAGAFVFNCAVMGC